MPPRSPHPITDKNVNFHTRFQTWPLKPMPVFRPGSGHETQHHMFTYKRNYVIIAEIKTATKRFLKLHFEFAYYTSFLSHFGIETTNTLIHNRSTFVNHTRFQTKMGKVYTRFQTKTAQKPYPLGRQISLWLIKGSTGYTYSDIFLFGFKYFHFHTLYVQIEFGLSDVSGFTLISSATL